MKYFLILNPGSRGGRSQKHFKKIFNILDSHKVQYDYKLTNSLDDAYRFSTEANIKGYDIITAVGGDGTINRVLNGFYDNNGKRLSDSRFGVIYTGTSPDFCKSYNIPIKLENAIDVLLKNNTDKIQIGKITFTYDFDNKYTGKSVNEVKDIKIQYFSCCANIGIGASLARAANSGIRKKIGDYAGTFLSLLKTLNTYRPSEFIIRHDNGHEEIVDNVFNISVGKTYYIASGIKVKNNLQNGDGRFYKLTVRNIKMQDWLGVFKKIYCGKYFDNNSVISLDYCKTIEIYGSKCEVEFDGDSAGYLPCKIEIADEPLEIICEVQNE